MKKTFKLFTAIAVLILSMVLLVSCVSKDKTALIQATDNLKIEQLLGGNTNKDSVTRNLSLITKDGDVTITWSSSDTTVIATDGKVTRKDVDKTVTLTATLTLNKFSETKEFVFIVKANEVVEEEAYKVTIILGEETLVIEPNEENKISLDGLDKEGHTLVGFKDEDDNDIALDFTVTKDITLTPVYNINTYTVKFVDNSNTTIKEQEVAYKESATAPDAPALEGHTFDKWDKDFSSITTNLTVKATYKIKTYTITFLDSDGETVLETKTVNHGVVPSLTTTPTKAANNEYTYVFDGFTVAAVAATEDFTYTAKYTQTPVDYVLTWNVDGEETNVTYPFGSEIITIDGPVKVGHTFKKWDVAVPATMPAENVTITAEFDINTYTISFVLPNELELDDLKLEFGATIELTTAPVIEDLKFVGWYIDEELTVRFTATTIPAEDLVLYAYYTGNTIITLDPKEGTVSPQVVDKAAGEEVELPEATKDGYNFAGWFLDEELTEKFDNIVPEEDITLYAKYDIKVYQVTFNDKDGELIEVVDVEHGADAVAPDVPEVLGYGFNGWNLAITNVTDDLTVEATYVLTVYTITYELNGGTNNVDNPVEYTFETATITLEDATKEYNIFLGWFDAAEEGNEVTEITLGSSGNVKLYARWEEISAEEKLETAINEIELPNQIGGNAILELPETGLFDTTITWVVIEGADIFNILTGKVSMPDAPTNIVLEATIALGDLEDTKKFTITVLLEDQEAVIKYEASDNDTNFLIGVNHANLLGLDEELFTVNAIPRELKSGSIQNVVGFKTGEIRLYGKPNVDGRNQLYVTIKEGYIITSLKITFKGGNNSPSSALLVLGGNDVNLTASDLVNTSKEYEGLSINGFSIWNNQSATGSNSRIDIDSIELTYNFGVANSVFEPISLKKLSFNTDGGTNINDWYFEDGDEFTYPKTASKSGYNFENWYLDETFSEILDESFVLTEDTILYAKFERKSAEVLVGEAKNALNINTDTITEDVVITLPATGLHGTTITWSVKEGQESLIDLSTGQITMPEKTTNLELTATIELEDKTNTKKFVIELLVIAGNQIVVSSNFSIIPNSEGISSKVFNSEHITVNNSANDSSGVAKYYTSGNAARFYGKDGKGSSLEIIVAEGYKIISVEFIFPKSNQTGGNVTITSGTATLMNGTTNPANVLYTFSEHDGINLNNIKIQNTTTDATTQFRLEAVNIIIEPIE